MTTDLRRGDKQATDNDNNDVDDDDHDEQLFVIYWIVLPESQVTLYVVKACSHLTFAFVSTSMFVLNFNIMLIVTQMQMQRMGGQPFFVFIFVSP